MRIVIPGDPIPKLRPKFARRGKFVTVYDIQGKDAKYAKEKILDSINDYLNNGRKSAMSLSSIANGTSFQMDFTFCFAPNKSDSVVERNLKLWNITKHNTKPDGSNLIKFYEDCGNEILYHDDAMIIEGSFKKRYSKIPHTVINIMTKDEFVLSEEAKAMVKCFDPEELMEFLDDIQHLANYRVVDKENFEPDEQWIASASFHLMNFSLKYGEKLKKINKACGKVSGEGKILC